MADVPRDLDTILRRVEKPSRYIGGEWNAVKKDPNTVKLKFALCFPDLYEIGMSHLGYKILYSLLNSHKQILAERVFTPWVDMQMEMKEREMRLRSLENTVPLDEFDIVGFSLQYELNYTNVLAMLELGGVPLRSDQRNEDHPLIIAGGPAAFNPEPLTEFVDLFLIGDGEQSVMELVDLVLDAKKDGASREETILAASRLSGVYAPSLYGAADRNGLSVPEPVGGAPFPIHKRIVTDIEAYPFPESVIVPHCEIVHDRVSFEIMRGCLTGCRFCQAGYVYRPKRERDPARVRDAVKRSMTRTGYEEASLTSLNSGEYSGIRFLISSLMKDFEGDAISLSLPSLKPSSLTDDIVREIKKVRKTGFTIAPEAATERLRAVINKNINEEHIMQAAQTAFREGWRLLKLYFMIGLPTEGDDDVEGITHLVKKIFKEVKTELGRKIRMNVSLSSFVPKPHTPFQWLPMEELGKLDRKQRLLKDRLSGHSVRVKWHNVKMSFLEAVLSRGDRKLNGVIEEAYRRGCCFDGWTDRFNFEKWMEAFESNRIDPSEYAYRRIDPDADLPWDIIDTGIRKSFLKGELERALKGEMTRVCSPEMCHGCATFASDCKQVPTHAAQRPVIVESTSRDMEINPDDKREYRYRTQYEKRGAMKFLSHLDLSRTITRGMRRAGIPLVHGKGFNPLPRISFGPALQLGIESLSEYLDFYSREYIHEEGFPERLNMYMPDGVFFKKIKEIPHKARSLSDSLNLALYRIQSVDILNNVRVLERLEKLKELRESGEQQPLDSVWHPHHAAAVKEISSEGADSLKIMLFIAGPRKARINDILQILVGSEQLNPDVFREEIFWEKDGKTYSPFCMNGVGREYAKRDDH